MGRQINIKNKILLNKRIQDEIIKILDDEYKKQITDSLSNGLEFKIDKPFKEYDSLYSNRLDWMELSKRERGCIYCINFNKGEKNV